MSDVNQDTELRRLIAAAIEKRRFGVDYGYDVSWQIAQLPTPAGPRSCAVYSILLTRRSPLLGQGDLFHVAQIPSPRPSAELVDEQVAEGIRLLEELHARQKQLPPQAPPGREVPPLALANGRGRR
jgi:hypothetical protein